MADFRLKVSKNNGTLCRVSKNTGANTIAFVKSGPSSGLSKLTKNATAIVYERAK